MSAFAQWLSGFLFTFVEWIFNSFVDLLQLLSDSLADFAMSVISLFPSGSLMPSLPSAPTGGTFLLFLQALNWLAPIGFFAQLISWASAGMLLYLVIAPLARWLKLLT